MKGQMDKYNHLPICCKCPLFFTHWQFHQSDYSLLLRIFFSSSIFSVWILFHNQHNVLLFVCVYITDLHSNHIFSLFPSMLKCRCSRSSWEKVVCAKYTVGINKHFIRPWKRVKPMYGGGAELKKGGKKTPLSSFEWAVWEVIINR